MLVMSPKYADMRLDRARQTIDWMELHLGVERLPVPPRIETIKNSPTPAEPPVPARQEATTDADEGRTGEPADA